NVSTARRWTRVTATAWDDAQDGTLSGNPVAAWLNDSAQRTPVRLDAGGHGNVRLLFAFGRTARDARTALAEARATSADDVILRDAEAWRARSRGVAAPEHLPDSFSTEDRARIVRAARRAVLHVYAGTDRASGAIVASIARQAPYGLDWPR